MASLTIRKLHEAVKAELRLRAARNGRSVEDEVRVILKRPRPPFPRPTRVIEYPAAQQFRVTGIHSIHPMACAT